MKNSKNTRHSKILYDVNSNISNDSESYNIQYVEGRISSGSFTVEQDS